MSGFKVGDLIRVKDDEHHGENNGSIYKIKKLSSDHSQYPYHADKISGNGREEDIFNDNEIERADGTMDGLVKGDILLDNEGDKYTVLARVEELIALSVYNEPKYFGEWVTIETAKGVYRRPNQESDVKEMTLDEVAELAGVDVSKIRIKE